MAHSIRLLLVHTRLNLNQIHSIKRVYLFSNLNPLYKARIFGEKTETFLYYSICSRTEIGKNALDAINFTKKKALHSDFTFSVPFSIFFYTLFLCSQKTGFLVFAPFGNEFT